MTVLSLTQMATRALCSVPRSDACFRRRMLLRVGRGAATEYHWRPHRKPHRAASGPRPRQIAIANSSVGTSPQRSVSIISVGGPTFCPNRAAHGGSCTEMVIE